MIMPVNQRCPSCGSMFMGSDAVGDPCPKCNEYEFRLTPMKERPVVMGYNTSDHKHLILRFSALDDESHYLKDKQFIDVFFWNLINRLGMEKLECKNNPLIEYCDIDGLKGISAVCLITTSHIVLHIWDEDVPAVIQLDVYSCKEFNTEDVLNTIDEFFKSAIVHSWKLFDRKYEIIEEG